MANSPDFSSLTRGIAGTKTVRTGEGLAVPMLTEVGEAGRECCWAAARSPSGAYG